MQPRTWIVTAVTAALLTGKLATGAEPSTEVVKAQKEAALANWKRLFGDEAAPERHETTHFLLYGAPSFTERQLKAQGAALEGQLALARKALQIDAKEEVWPGKLAVYLFDQRSQFTSFVRGVEKRRPEPEDLGSYALRGQQPHLGAGPPQGKYDPGVELQAAEQLGAALLSKKGGKDVPGWVVAGFGRATAWRATPAASADDRKQLRRLVRERGRSARDAWGGALLPDEAPLVRASVVEYLAYGPASPSFPAFLEAFKPDEEGNKAKPKSTGEALKAIKVSPDRLDRAWQAWAASGR
jgi:hypothetical protein